MKGKRFTEEQIFKILKRVESGEKVRQVCRKAGVHEQTYYRWKSKYGGMEISDLKRMKVIEDENRCLKRLVAEQALDIQALRYVNEKKW